MRGRGFRVPGIPKPVRGGTATVARVRARTARRSPSDSSRSLLQEGAGTALLVLVGVAAVGLATYDPADPILSLAPVGNAAGPVGATLAHWIHRSVGTAGYGLLAAVALGGLRLLAGGALPRLGGPRIAAALLLLLSWITLPPLLAAVFPERFSGAAGGAVGDFAAGALMALFSGPGGLVVAGALFGVGLLGVLGVPPAAAVAAAAATGEAVARAATLGLGLAGRRLGQLREAAVRGGRTAARALHLFGVAAAERFRALEVRREQRARKARVEAIREEELAESAPSASEAGPPPAGAATKRGRSEPEIVEHREAGGAAQESFSFDESAPEGEYRPPPLDLFQLPPRDSRSVDRQSLIMNSRILEKKLRDFGVHGRVVTVHPGPVITMYEFEPAPGIKVARIAALADDLALALRALSVRIVAPIPGTSVVGIEVPNRERETVYLRELLEAPSFRQSGSRLTAALGKDIFGKPVEGDLARMPHLLVAGATGTGKSVFLNSVLCSILSRARPDELKILLIDPKLLELSIYEGIPHLIADVVTHPKRAAAALGGIVQKMEDRYRMMSALSVRNIDRFNARVDELRRAGETHFRLKPLPGEEEGEEVELRRLPYILVVIDELADLMVVSARDVEESLQRLAQMARAAGIHLVLATQRPSVDVLTGIIKANFPSRIAFQVASRTDSRTILDTNGAEHLLGQGDMLFLPPGTSRVRRLHGAFVSEKEVSKVVTWLREQGKPQFDETLLRVREETERREERGSEVDEMFDAAVELVARTRNASISHVQRRLKIGYNRAARMIEEMEREGMIGPQEGTRPRDVYLPPPVDAE